MSANFTTVKAITDNVQSVLQGQGIKFSRSTFEDEKAIPVSLLPLGEIFYQGENFEYTHGQRAGYAVANFSVKVTLVERNTTDLMRSAQKWVHAVRDALTVNALNIVDLATSKLVSWVEVIDGTIESRETYAFVVCKVRVRYRET